MISVKGSTPIWEWLFTVNYILVFMIIFFILLIIHGMEGIIWEKAPLLSGIQSSFITDLLKTSITNDPERPETFGKGCDMLYGKKKNTDLPKMRNTFCRLARRLIKEDRVEGGWSMVGPDKGRGVCLPETTHKSHTKWNLCVEKKRLADQSHPK